MATKKTTKTAAPKAAKTLSTPKASTRQQSTSDGADRQAEGHGRGGVEGQQGDQIERQGSEERGRLGTEPEREAEVDASPTEQRQQEVEGPLARALSVITEDPARFDGLPDLPPVTLEHWRDGPVGGLVGHLSLERPHCLLVELEGPEDRLRKVFLARSRTSDGELAGRGPRGSKLKATWLNRYGNHSAGDRRPGSTKVGFQLFEWSLVPPTAPRIWVGRLHGLAQAPAYTNLTVVTYWGRNWLQLLLPQEDGYDYAVICVDAKSDHYLLVVDTKGCGSPDRNILHADFAVLEFLNAARLRVERFVGLDDDCEIAGYVGSAFGRYDRDPLLAARPIPLLPGKRCWALPAFRRLAPVARTGPRVVRLAMDYYLASFTGYPDEAYLKLTVALEGLAIEVLRERGDASGVVQERSGDLWRVRDPRLWKKYLRELRKTPEYAAWEALLVRQRSTIEEHALPHAGLSHPEKLFNSLRLPSSSATGQLSAGRRVEAAFAALGLSLDDAMRREAGLWHRARHEAVPDTISEADGLHPQLWVLRAMLVALLLRWVGYLGPVRGYERDGHGRLGPARTAWWGDPSTVDPDDSDVRFLVPRWERGTADSPGAIRRRKTDS